MKWIDEFKLQLDERTLKRLFVSCYYNLLIDDLSLELVALVIGCVARGWPLDPRHPSERGT